MIRNSLYSMFIAIALVPCLPAARAAFPPPLPGDIDGNGAVNVGDLQLLVATWNRTRGDPGFNPEADFNCDQIIGVADLQILVAGWNT